MTPLLQLVAMCAGIVAIGVSGGALVIAHSWGRDRLGMFIAFGAGAMLGAAFLHMIPEAAEKVGPSLGGLALAGFLSLFLLEKFVLAHPCEEQGCDYHGMGMAAFIGMSFHNLVEGVSLGMSQVSHLGAAVFLAIVSHKLPNAMALAILLQAAGYSRRRVLGLLTLFAAMVPLGALGAYAIARDMEADRLVGGAIAVAAGTFLHVAASDLLPEVHRAGGRLGGLGAFGGGLALMAAARLLHP